MALKHHANAGGGAARVTMHVAQALLQNAEECDFDVFRHACELGRQRKVNPDAAAADEPIYVPLHGGAQADFVQQGRVQQIRESTKVGGYFFRQVGATVESGLGLGRELGGVLLQQCDVEGETSYFLSRAVVEVAGNAAALFVL